MNIKDLIDGYQRRLKVINELLAELEQIKKTKYYVFGVWGDVYPMITIAFNTPEERDAEARRIYKANDMDEGGIFHLDIDSDGMPIVGTYSEDDLNREGPTDAEIEKFKEYWGQTDDEIRVNLGLKEENIDDELLMDDYFWIPNDMIWCNKHASTFTARDQEIADFLIKSLSRID